MQSARQGLASCSKVFDWFFSIVQMKLNHFMDIYELFHPSLSVIWPEQCIYTVEFQIQQEIIQVTHLWPLLLTWFNFNPSMDK